LLASLMVSFFASFGSSPLSFCNVIVNGNPAELAGGREDARAGRKNQIALGQAEPKKRHKIALKPRKIEHIIIS